jgi:hypothetical protein
MQGRAVKQWGSREAIVFVGIDVSRDWLDVARYRGTWFLES